MSRTNRTNRKGVTVATTTIEHNSVEPDRSMYIDVSVNPTEPTEPTAPTEPTETLSGSTETLSGSTALTPTAPTEPTEVYTVDQLRAHLVHSVNIMMHGNASWWGSSANRETRINGVGTPRGNGLCYTAWVLFDHLFATGIIDTASIVAIGVAHYGLNRNNLATELSNYRKRHGYLRARGSIPVEYQPVIVAPTE